MQKEGRKKPLVSVMVTPREGQCVVKISILTPALNFFPASSMMKCMSSSPRFFGTILRAICRNTLSKVINVRMGGLMKKLIVFQFYKTANNNNNML